MALTRAPSKIPREKLARGPHPRFTTATGRIPMDANSAQIEVDGRAIQLTNLQKLFWRDEGIRKGDLLRFYASIAEFLLPHLVNRAMVMKRYPNGAGGPFFF